MASSFVPTLLILLGVLQVVGVCHGQNYPGAPGQGYGPAPGAAYDVNAGYQPYDRGGYGEPAAGVSNRLPVPMPRDDNASVAGVINDMSKLDNTRKLEAGDVVSFRIVEEGSANAVKSLRLNESGAVNIPHLGMVIAAGKTCYTLARQLSVELQKDFFRKATVIIVLDTSWKERMQDAWGVRSGVQDGRYFGGASYVTIFGQIGRQGRMPLPTHGALTISTAILQAGGFAQFANTRKVRILRRIGENERRTIIVDVDSIIRRGYLNKDVELKKDDVIIVPEKLINF
jgi:protein involved in polysaccharide export with SLBB domain